MELDRTREEPLLDVKERLEVDEAREEPLLVHEDEALVRHLLETRATPSWMPLMIVASAGIALSADVPLLPAMMARFGKGPRGVAWWVGVAQGCYSAAQFVSSPLIGHCSDVRGRRPFVLGALATSCAATLLCGFASSAAQVVGLRVLAGLTNNNVALARALVAEAPAATAGARAERFALLGAVFSASRAGASALTGCLSAAPAPAAHPYATPLAVASAPIFATLCLAACCLGGKHEPAPRRRLQLAVQGGGAAPATPPGPPPGAAAALAAVWRDRRRRLTLVLVGLNGLQSGALLVGLVSFLALDEADGGVGLGPAPASRGRDDFRELSGGKPMKHRHRHAW